MRAQKAAQLRNRASVSNQLGGSSGSAERGLESNRPGGSYAGLTASRPNLGHSGLRRSDFFSLYKHFQLVVENSRDAVGRLDLGLVVDGEHSVHPVFVRDSLIVAATHIESMGLLVTAHSDLAVGLSRLSFCPEGQSINFGLIRRVAVHGRFDLCQGHLTDGRVILSRDESVEFPTHSELRTGLLIVDAATGRQRYVSVPAKKPVKIVALKESCALEVEKENGLRVFEAKIETF